MRPSLHQFRVVRDLGMFQPSTLALSLGQSGNDSSVTCVLYLAHTATRQSTHDVVSTQIIAISVPHLSIHHFHVARVLSDVKQRTIQSPVPHTSLYFSVTRKQKTMRFLTVLKLKFTIKRFKPDGVTDPVNYGMVVYYPLL